MSWRVVATVLTVVTVLVIVQSALASPLHETTTQLNETGDYGDLDGVSGYDGNQVITGLWDDWMKMGLIGMFGIMLWGTARVVRKELTRGGQP